MQEYMNYDQWLMHVLVKQWATKKSEQGWRDVSE
jgi:hypothetical protein